MQLPLVPLAVVATCLVTAWFQLPLRAHARASSRSPVPGQANQAPNASAIGARAAHAEIRAFFDQYLRLHEQKDMQAWPRLFLDGATIVRTGSDARVLRYSPTELAARIASEAAELGSQHETFEDIRIEADGNAAMYSTLWKLFHNGKLVREGRAWFSLVKVSAEDRSDTTTGAKWRIASLVWYNH